MGSVLPGDYLSVQEDKPDLILQILHRFYESGAGSCGKKGTSPARRSYAGTMFILIRLRCFIIIVIITICAGSVPVI